MAIDDRSYFFALRPAAQVRQACQASARDLLQRMPTGERPVPPENYHVTLLYLGRGLDERQTAAVRQCASLVRSPPFSVKLDVAGSFPRASAWWLGCRRVPDELQQLHDQLARRAAPLLELHRRSRYVPHLTIARASAPLPPTLIKIVTWPISSFCLMRSCPPANRGGNVSYEEIARWELAGTRPFKDEQLALL